MSTQGVGRLSRRALVDSLLDKLSWDDCLTIAQIEGCLMVPFITINKMVMVDDTNNEIEYIKTILHNLEQTSTSRVKQVDEDSHPSVIDLLDSSEEEISGNELDGMQEQQEGKGKEELPGIPEDQDDSDLGIMLITNNAPRSHYPGPTVKHKHHDFDIQYVEELDHVDADFNNIGLMELEGANNRGAQAQKEDLTNNVNVDR
jgi:hypothetical protein